MLKEILLVQGKVYISWNIPFYFESCPKILTNYSFDKDGWLFIKIHDPPRPLSPALPPPTQTH